MSPTTTEHEHEIGPIQETPCLCGALHAYCETCLEKLDPCPIYDAPKALRDIRTLCQDRQEIPTAEVLAIIDPLLD